MLFSGMMLSGDKHGLSGEFRGFEGRCGMSGTFLSGNKATFSGSYLSGTTTTIKKAVVKKTTAKKAVTKKVTTTKTSSKTTK